MNKSTTTSTDINSLRLKFLDLYHDIVSLQALLTVFSEALWRMKGSTPSDDNLLPTYVDIAEYQCGGIKDRAVTLYAEINSLCRKESQLVEGGTSDE